MYRHDYESLIRNSVWKEIVSTLEEVKQGLQEDCAELLPHGEEAVKLARQQGRLKMVDFLLQMPVAILQEIEEEERRAAEARKAETEDGLDE